MKNSHPLWATKHRTSGTELRFINGRYYLYAYKTIYDPIDKRPKKLSGSIIGRIIEKEGLVKSDKSDLKRQLAEKNVSIRVGQYREFGISQYLLNHMESLIIALKQNFEEDWKAIIMLAYCRLLYQSPIKRMPIHIHHSWLYEHWSLDVMSDKSISILLRKLGHQRNQIVKFMSRFISQGEYLLVDTTNISSKSEQLDFNQKGYNNKKNYDPQFNLMYLYNAMEAMPSFYRLHPGNIR